MSVWAPQTFAYDPEFMPSKLNTSFTGWTGNGLMGHYTFQNQGEVPGRNHCRRRNQDGFRFLQLRTLRNGRRNRDRRLNMMDGHLLDVATSRRVLLKVSAC